MPAADRFLPAPVTADQGAVQDDVAGALGQSPLEGLAQLRGLRGQHLDDLIQVAVGGGLGQAEPGAQPRDAHLVPEPGQPEQRLPVAAQPAGVFPGPDLAAAGSQQPGNEHDQGNRNIESGTIGDHAEPFRGGWVLWRDLLYRGLRVPPGHLLLCPRVFPYACYITYAWISATEKTSLRNRHR
jgi:hypothetical protein